MRKYREFKADYPAETDAVSGHTNFDTILTTIDLYSVVSFNPGSFGDQTTVRMSDGCMFDLRISYKEFKKLMRAEVPELFTSSN